MKMARPLLIIVMLVSVAGALADHTRTSAFLPQNILVSKNQSCYGLKWGNQDCPGNDLKMVLGISVNTSDLDAIYKDMRSCASMCANSTACVAMNYFGPSTSWKNRTICYLKRVCNFKISQPGCGIYEPVDIQQCAYLNPPAAPTAAGNDKKCFTASKGTDCPGYDYKMVSGMKVRSWPPITKEEVALDVARCASNCSDYQCVAFNYFGISNTWLDRTICYLKKICGARVPSQSLLYSPAKDPSACQKSSQTYHCHYGKCVPAPTGVNISTCDRVCLNSTDV